MSRTFEVFITKVVEVTVEEEGVISRTQEPTWKRMFYDLSEAETVEMLAENIGLHEHRLNEMDGWADCSPDLVKAHESDVSEYETWEVLPDKTRKLVK